MDKEKTYKETPKQRKSASGIWDWILWILFASVAIVVVIGVWYALKMMPPEGAISGGGMVPIDKDDKMMSTKATPEGAIHGGMVTIDKDDNKDKIIW